MTLRTAIETTAAQQLSMLTTGRLAIAPPQALQGAVERVRRRFGAGLRVVASQDRINRAAEWLAQKGASALTGRERFLLAYNLAAPVAALRGAAIVAEPPLFEALMHRWEHDVALGTLRGVIYRGLYRSYLQTPPGRSAEQLRQLLLFGLPGVTARSRRNPEWLRIVQRHQGLLGEAPCRLYVAELMEGRRAMLDELTDGFSPPPGSWFWGLLVRALAEQLERVEDAVFRSRIPLLLSLSELDGLVARRDELLAMILERYAHCQARPCHELLRDVALEHWKNPHLATSFKWDLVVEPARRMVGGWLAFEDLEDFFRLCQDSRQADEIRLAYWLRFRHQITFSQIVIGTALDRSRDPQIVRLRERRPGRLARLTLATHDTNALIMQIGDWVFVVFSSQGGDCYPYRQGSLPMQLGSLTYTPHELRDRRAMAASDARTFAHLREWQVDLDDTLRFWGIRPDEVRAPVPDARKS